MYHSETSPLCKLPNLFSSKLEEPFSISLELSAVQALFRFASFRLSLSLYTRNRNCLFSSKLEEPFSISCAQLISNKKGPLPDLLAKGELSRYHLCLDITIYLIRFLTKSCPVTRTNREFLLCYTNVSESRFQSYLLHSFLKKTFQPCVLLSDKGR